MAIRSIAVRLSSIKAYPANRKLFVSLSFDDSRGKRRVRTYKAADFLAAMELITSRDRRQRMQGLGRLGLESYQVTRSSNVLHLKLDDGSIGNLGDPAGPSGSNDLLTMLHEDSPRPTRLRRAIRNGEGYEITRTLAY